jgi:uncharacterized protein DUF6788
MTTRALHKTGLQARSSVWKRGWELVARLDRHELEAFDRRIHQRLKELARPAPGYTDREVVEEVTEGAVTYQLERVRCGKRRCHCMKGGKAHGPYWYAYFWKGGRVVSEYVGKKRKPARSER